MGRRVGASERCSSSWERLQQVVETHRFASFVENLYVEEEEEGEWRGSGGPFSHVTVLCTCDQRGELAEHPAMDSKTAVPAISYNHGWYSRGVKEPTAAVPM